MVRQRRLLMGLFALVTAAAGVLGTGSPGQAATSRTVDPLVSAVFHLEQQENLRCADIRSEDGQTQPGARVQLRPCAAGNVNQEWTPIRISGNTYLLEVVVSGQCMDLAGGSTADGTQVVQEPCDASRTTQWWTTNGVLPPGATPIQNGAAPECLDSQGSFVKIITCGIPVSTAQTWFFTQ